MATQTSHVFHGQENMLLENHCIRRNTGRDSKKSLKQKNVNGLGQNSDNGLLVTHVNQTQDLLRLQASETQSSDWEDSEDWLSAHSLKCQKLTLADLISQGTEVLTIEVYQERIQWLTENSKKAFGLIKGARVSILIDVSAISSGPQKEEFQKDLMSLIDEQLSHKEKLFILSFGTNARSLWPDPMEVSASVPDQPSEILSDYIQQSTMGRDLIIHFITYSCDDQLPPAILKNLAEAVRGYYHCYSPKMELYTSRDMDELLAEIQKAQSLLSHVQALRHSSPCEALTCTMEEVLAPNAFSPVEEFVPILQKTVSSTIHEKAMIQFEWHDGTVKNIHVDPPFLYEYQKQLNRAMRMYERRIEWLSLASRRIGALCVKKGTFPKQGSYPSWVWVVVLLDISATNSMYIIHIQHSLRLLLEEQLSNKDYFNLIAFGSTIESWRPEMVPMSHDNLQSAWRWALNLRCWGSRNVLGALRKAVEVDFKDKDKHQSQGIYLFTGGIPDQDMPTLSAYMAEACSGCDLQLNVCLFYVGEPKMDTTPPACYASRTDTAAAYKEVTRAAGGRFHWFGDTGIYESDDISSIMSEMEKALNYSQKCAFLMASLKNHSRKVLGSAALLKEKPKTLQLRSQPKKLCPPRPTAPLGARMTVGSRFPVKGLPFQESLCSQALPLFGELHQVSGASSGTSPPPQGLPLEPPVLPECLLKPGQIVPFRAYNDQSFASVLYQLPIVLTKELRLGGLRIMCH
ncbi:hypothetical protein H8959_001168 [Pygathrix nigripes]